MRPEILFHLFADATTLPGVGPRTGEAISALCGQNRVIDLLWHLPGAVIDRRHTPTITAAQPGTVATIKVVVGKHRKAPGRRVPYRVTCTDETGAMTLVFFHAREDYLRRILPEGETRLVSGQIEEFDRGIQITHPDYIVPMDEKDTVQRVEPVYGLTAGLSNKMLVKAMASALEKIPVLPEWLDRAHVDQNAWMSWQDSLKAAHAPQETGDLEAGSPARTRLAYDELLANQLALAIVRRSVRKHKGRSISAKPVSRTRVLETLPFELTDSQKTAIADIESDMRSDDRMLRLLQGDVGSGKTVVALLSMLTAVDAGYQAALMAPTEVLARQHFETIENLCPETGVHPVLLTGREKGDTRERVLADVAGGRARIVIGTHALFQETIKYDNLAFAVIDEQHRFGVHQRLTLADKGRNVDILVMTATPIPRTLTLTTYGDMEVSRLTEKPAGRHPIATRAVPIGRMADVVQGVKRSIGRGKRTYWICPLVEESEKTDAAAAEDRARDLGRQLGEENVGLIHGRMKGPDKDAVMSDFKTGRIRVLVGTTVVEVGVDVPEATIMVIERAERFGLSQLHQLRGRVGRGHEAASCILLYAPDLSRTARERLNIIRNSEDGFEIAEKDLELRGAGELLGTRQSGLPEFRVADLACHGDLLAAARRDAQLILERDPELGSERGAALRQLLYLFERDSAIRNLRSG